MKRFKNIFWLYLVLLGAPINVFVNYGYQILSRQSVPLPWIMAGSLVITSITLFCYGFFVKKGGVLPLFLGWTPIAILMMGTGIPFVFVCFLTALSTGPISLIDPLWACVYSLVSLFIGIMIIRERPSVVALFGVGLYLVGAVLMVQG